MKIFLSFCFLLLTFCCLAQDQSRIEVKGNIPVPLGFNAEGITIYNQTANRGAVSSENGDFLLKMKSGDSLVFSSIQFRELKIRVGQEVIYLLSPFGSIHYTNYNYTIYSLKSQVSYLISHISLNWNTICFSTFATFRRQT